MRSLPEWIGKNDDQKIPLRVKRRVWRRGDGFCASCGSDLLGVLTDIDHSIPLSMGGEHRENNLRVVCLICHMAKTRKEAKARAKADRLQTRHAGLRKPRKIRGWRRFDGTIVRAKEER